MTKKRGRPEGRPPEVLKMLSRRFTCEWWYFYLQEPWSGLRCLGRSSGYRRPLHHHRSCIRSCSNKSRCPKHGVHSLIPIFNNWQLKGLLRKSIWCFDKLSMNGKVTWFQHTTVRPEPVEGWTVDLGNSPWRCDPAFPSPSSVIPSLPFNLFWEEKRLIQ